MPFCFPSTAIGIAADARCGGMLAALHTWHKFDLALHNTDYQTPSRASKLLILDTDAPSVCCRGEMAQHLVF